MTCKKSPAPKLECCGKEEKRKVGTYKKPPRSVGKQLEKRFDARRAKRKASEPIARVEHLRPPPEQVHNQKALEAYDAHNRMLADMQKAIEDRKIRIISMRLREHGVEVDDKLPIEKRFEGLSAKTTQTPEGLQEHYFYKDMHLVIFDPVKVTNTYADGEFRTEASRKYH